LKIFHVIWSTSSGRSIEKNNIIFHYIEEKNHVTRIYIKLSY